METADGSQPRGRIPGRPRAARVKMEAQASGQSKKANADERPVTLADLPGDVLAHVAELTGSKLGDALPRLRATSNAMLRSFGKSAGSTSATSSARARFSVRLRR